MEKLLFLEKEDKQKIIFILKQQLKDIFEAGEKIAVKLHMGEEGNKFYLKPERIKPFVEALKQLGYKPFLFDSPVMYEGQRNTEEKYLKTAKKHGFDSLGVPIIISNEHIIVKMPHLTAEVCKILAEADGVLILSHVKGHICCGFGGAIKNLGMGAMSKKTKEDIHEGGKPVYKEGCIICGRCEQVCPTRNVRYENNRPYFDKTWCCGCSNCAIFCPVQAIKPKNAPFDTLLAEGAAAALKSFKKYYCVNVIMDIVKYCDCMTRKNPIVAEDIGIVFGKDIIAVEKASMDLINKQSGKDLFEEIHHKSPLKHIEEAERLGMGKKEYSIEKV